MSFLELKELRKVFPNGTEAVKNTSLAIDEGEFVVLLGPSGCGKTTTLRIVAGLETPTAGSVVMNGRDMTNLRPSSRDVGFVFQFYALYPHMSIRENILFTLRAAGLPRRKRDEALGMVTEQLSLSRLLDLYPRQLSGGDQQKVSLARAMVRKPAVYLMDEPLGTLDGDQRVAMREFIREQQTEMKVTTIYVTHDQEEAMSLADRIVVMDGGKILQVGSPVEIYDEPRDRFVAEFVGSPGMNFVDGEVIEEGGGRFFRAGNTAMTVPPGRGGRAGRMTLGVRPEHVSPGKDGLLSGRIAMKEYMGSHSFVHADTQWGRLVMRAGADFSGRPGDDILVDVAADKCRFFGDSIGAAKTAGSDGE